MFVFGFVAILEFIGMNAAGDSKNQWRMFECPPLVDLDELPDYQEARKQLQQADDHIKYIVARASLDLPHKEWYQARMQEAKKARQPWNELQWAHWCRYDLDGGSYSRWGLADLRDLIGPGAYLFRQIPPSIPPHHKELFP